VFRAPAWRYHTSYKVRAASQISAAKVGELEGRTVQPTPRSVLKGAYAVGWIDDEAGWIDLMRMRNLASHVYNETMARDIYRRIREKPDCCAPRSSP
jgi:nucleotidyltransferase substrate binding protein (TIGR01987 family)